MDSLQKHQGLSAQEVEQRRVCGLDNRQDFKTSRSLLVILRANVLTLFNAVVGFAFLLLLFLGQWQDALFGLAVLSNVAIGIAQEFRSKLVLDRLAILNRSPVRVRRDGELEEVAMTDVVLDDLIVLHAGEQIAADAELLECASLELDESLLTGEAEPQSKQVGDVVFAGSNVTGGNGLAKATKVGANTYASSILVDAKKFSLVSSELRDSINRLIKWISIALAPVTAIVLFGQLLGAENQIDALVRATASVISMVPQGLVLITSIAFAIAATKLARKKVLVQELAAVEGLARVDVVCIDKTGTLTTGVPEFDSATQLIDESSALSGVWPDVLGEFAADIDANATARVLGSRFEHRRLQVSSKVNFNSAQKWSSLTIDDIEWRLGAPEVLTNDVKILKRVEELAFAGKRAMILTADAEPICVISLSEKIRDDTKETLNYLRDQGVEVRVLSGDHPTTVAKVARAAGLDFEGEGFDARSLPEDSSELVDLMTSQKIFGRVTPEQKRVMISALQQGGRVVAMIGDGVNDALALKRADLGIAMGSGAPATRAVANLVLLESNFSAVPGILLEGRRVIANVERLSRLFLTKTVWAMLLAVTFGLLFWDFPFLPRQLSAVDGFAIGVPAFLLALLPNHQLYRPGFLRRSLLFCIPAGTVTAISVLLLSAQMLGEGSWTTAEMQTATSILLSLTSLWVLASLATPVTLARASILVVMVLTAFGLFSFQPAVTFFGFSALPADKVLTTALFGFAAVAVMWLLNLAIAKIVKFG